jgi:small-conductance mechanosensitive channel
MRKRNLMVTWENIMANIIYIKVAVIVVAAIILERLIARYLKRFSKRKELSPNLTNGLLLIYRFLILLAAVVIIMRIGGVPPDWLVAYTALGGAAIGFASTRTLGNFIAGLFVFVTRPFQINDYIRVDNVEGIVEEITFNYTKILTRSNILVFISNLKILDQNVVNYKYIDGKSLLYCYPFELAFDHSLSTSQLEKMFNELIERYAKKLPKKPEYIQLRIGAFDRVYLFNLYLKESQDIFAIHPAVVKEITEAWDRTRGK